MNGLCLFLRIFKEKTHRDRSSFGFAIKSHPYRDGLQLFGYAYELDDVHVGVVLEAVAVDAEGVALADAIALVYRRKFVELPDPPWSECC